MKEGRVLARTQFRGAADLGALRDAVMTATDDGSRTPAILMSCGAYHAYLDVVKGDPEFDGRVRFMGTVVWWDGRLPDWYVVVEGVQALSLS